MNTYITRTIDISNQNNSTRRRQRDEDEDDNNDDEFFVRPTSRGYDHDSQGTLSKTRKGITARRHYLDYRVCPYGGTSTPRYLVRRRRGREREAA